MENEIYDWTLRDYLQKVIAELPVNQRLTLKSLAYCGRNLTRRKGVQDGAVLLSNGSSSKLNGVMTCKNPFACPCCTAKVMSKYRSDIAAAIDLLRNEGYFAFMMTFTIPHTNNMTCREVTDYLYNSHKYFRLTAKTTYKTGRKGTVSKQFTDELDIKHSVAVCEYTWGENGWHPHFHCLYWVKRQYKDKILEWEDSLRSFWDDIVKREMKKVRHPKFVDQLFSSSKQAKVSLQIAKNTDGTIREALSSDYICGWGSDSEVTGNIRKQASHEGHYTPYQILKKAANGDKEMERLYIEFCLEVRRKPVHHRVRWSQTGLKAKIKVYKQQNAYRELIKQKKIAQERGKWEILCWFTPKQWTFIQENRHNYFLSNILWLAKTDKEILFEYMKNMQIEWMSPDSYIKKEELELAYSA